MNVLIPMSGTGSRFRDAGYKNIKPLINVFNKPIIKYIIDQFSPLDNFIFICRKEHLDNKDLNLKTLLKKLAKNVKVLKVDNHKLGPVHSILEIRESINLEEELIVNYCDFDWRWNYTNFKNWIKTEQPHAALCVYSGFQPHYANPAPYAHIRCDQNYLLQIKEKESFTNYRNEEPAASGTFYFKTGKILLDACDWLKKIDHKINGEYYVSLIFNYFPQRQKKCLIYYINNFMQWGTPEDLKEYIFLAKKVPLNFKKQEIPNLSIVTMAENNTTLKSISPIKKQYLKIDKQFLFQISSKNFKSEEKTKFVIAGDDEDKKNLSEKEFNKSILVGETNSSSETVLAFLKRYKINQTEDIFIIPSHTSVDFNWKKFLKLIKKNNDIDGVVFSFSDYPFAKWYPLEYNWIKRDKNNVIQEIFFSKEKKVNFLDPISTSFFWFPCQNILKNDLEKFLNNKQNHYTSFSLEEFCNYLVKHRKKIISYPVEDALFLNSVFEFRSYEYWLLANQLKPLHVAK